MQYSDTTNKNGLLQDCEQWCLMPDGYITGDTTRKAVFTNYLNREHERILAKIKNTSPNSQHHDSNYSNQPFSLFSFDTSNNSYQFLTTEDGYSITDITGLLIQKAEGSSEYTPLEKLTLDAEDAMLILSPNTTEIGVPTAYIESNLTIYLNKIPSFAGTGKLFHKTAPSYFTTSDTTKEPGYDSDYHQLLSQGASRRWLLINKSEEINLIKQLNAIILDGEAGLLTSTMLRNPSHRRMTALNSSSQ